MAGPASTGQVGPFTRAGIAVAVIGVATYVGAWRLGWIELMVVAAGCAMALLVALPFVLGRPIVDLTRDIDPARVQVGEVAFAHLTATNRRRRRTRRFHVDDRVRGGADGADHTVALDIPPLAPAEVHRTLYDLPTDRRGVYTVGPAVVSRADALSLLRRSAVQTAADELWVHPRWTLVRALPAGFVKDLEGPTSDTSPAGEIAFHAIRPYRYGDDRRHIHWMSTARTGNLMVRHYVDNRRPALGVLFDTEPAAYDDVTFELAVSVAASLTISSLHGRLPVCAVTSSSWLLGRLRPGDEQSVLESFTTVAPSTGPGLVDVAANLLRHESATSAVAIVTGRRDPLDLVRCVRHVRRHARPIVISVSTDPEEIPVALPGARHHTVRDLDELRAAWNGLG